MSNSRIYVASLSHYNNGELVGKWLDVDRDLKEKVYTFLESVNSEEYGIHDYEGFGEYQVFEYADLNNLIEIAEMIEQHGELFSHVLSYVGGGIPDAVSMIEDKYQGCHSSLPDFINGFVDDIGLLSGCSETVKSYFDYSAYLRDMEIGGDLISFQIDNEHHIFLN